MISNVLRRWRCSSIHIICSKAIEVKFVWLALVMKLQRPEGLRPPCPDVFCSPNRHLYVASVAWKLNAASGHGLEPAS